MYDPHDADDHPGRKIVTSQGAHTVMLMWDGASATFSTASHRSRDPAATYAISVTETLMARRADACLLVYDVGDRAGFDALGVVYDRGVAEALLLPQNPRPGTASAGGTLPTRRPVVVVVATKTDLGVDT